MSCQIDPSMPPELSVPVELVELADLQANSAGPEELA
jgi:hypothetical protein